MVKKMIPLVSLWTLKFQLWLVVQFGDTVIVLRDREFWLTNAIGLYLLSGDGLNNLSQQ